MERRCLYCYQPLEEGEIDFHNRCSRKFFGTSVTPILPYTRAQLGENSCEEVRTPISVSDAQPLLTLDLQRVKDVPPSLKIVRPLGGRYILRLQTPQFPHLPEVEDLSMHLAEVLKIDTAPHSLIRFGDGELGYISRRIDRAADGTKIAMEDMCQLSERLSEDKSKGSQELVAKLITQYSDYAGLDLVKYWEQVVFSFVIGNANMHMKKYSLYSPDDSAFYLAPACDLLSTKLVIPQDTNELALTLCDRKIKLKREHFVKAMTESGLAPKVIERIFAKYEKALPKIQQLIYESFLPDDMKIRFFVIIITNLNILYDRG